MAARQKNGGSTPLKNRKTEKKSTMKTNRKKSVQETGNPFWRKEVKGLAVFFLGVLVLLSILNIGLGAFGSFVKTICSEVFGITSFILALGIMAMGIRIIMGKKAISFTTKGLQIASIILALMVMFLLFMVPQGQEWDPEYIVLGGIIFNGMTLGLRSLLGTVGTAILAVGVLILNGIAFQWFSAKEGLRKAHSAATDIGNLAKEKAEEQFEAAKEHIEEWQEQRKEEREKNAVYNQEKDPKYPTNFDDIPEEEHITTAPQGYVEEVSPFTEENDPRGFVTEVPEKEDIWGTEAIEAVEKPYEAPVVPTPIEEDSWATMEEMPTSESPSTVDENHVVAKDDEEMAPYEEVRENPFTSVQEHPSETNTEVDEVVGVNEEDPVEEKGNILETLDPTAAYEGAASETAAVSVSKEGREVPIKVEIPYQFPPLSLLAPGKAMEDIDEEVEEKARLLEETLQSFKIDAKIINATKGPAVTRYELEPARGVKVSKIVSLTDDIALNLAAADIRMEAPIPGKAAIGIEIPNSTISAVNLRDVLDCDDFLQAKGGIPVGLGKDIAGKSVITDLSKMPHLLVAGSTGSGKSVCINTIIISLLYKASPDDVKLIMIDPKVVELSVYNGIPHLFIPVVTDPKKAAGALNWAVAEMTDRYNKFAQYNVRDLKGYNAKVESISDIEDENKPKKLPQIVIIVDELADLMMVAPGEVEDSICRLAQLARAAGIHLIIATQRPSVNVITGLIKANMPSRIAFSVSSGVDSRTILDMNGAEKLLGKGDMLFYPQGYQKPARVQGAFVSDQEVGAVVDFLSKQNPTAEYDKEIQEKIEAVKETTAAGADTSNDRDVYFADAGKFIIEKDKASIGMLQRVFKIGFNRAARIMDQLNEAGVVGDEEGTKPRKVLMSMEEFEQYIDEYL